jgi:hypothetical protein
VRPVGSPAKSSRSTLTPPRRRPAGSAGAQPPICRGSRWSQRSRASPWRCCCRAAGLGGSRRCWCGTSSPASVSAIASLWVPRSFASRLGNRIYQTAARDPEAKGVVERQRVLGHLVHARARFRLTWRLQHPDRRRVAAGQRPARESHSRCRPWHRSRPRRLRGQPGLPRRATPTALRPPPSGVT